MSGDWPDEDFEMTSQVPSLPYVQPERHNPAPPKDVIFLCDWCRRHVLQMLHTRWWCHVCGERPVEPTLIYDRRV